MYSITVIMAYNDFIDTHGKTKKNQYEFIIGSAQLNSPPTGKILLIECSMVLERIGRITSDKKELKLNF